MDTMRWQQHAGLAAGAWLIASSWALSALHAPLTLAANAIVVGAALIVFAIFAEVLHMRWRERHTLVLAAWTFAAVVALEFAHVAVPLILVGFVALATAAWAITIVKQQSRRREIR